MATPTLPQRAVALSLASDGVAVFPCGEDKSPLVGKGYHAATTDLGRVRDWWERWPDALVGTPVSAYGEDVIVIDSLPGERVHLPNAGRIVKTPNGYHYFARAPKPDYRIPKAGPELRELIPGAEVLRCAGTHYVIAAGNPGYVLEQDGDMPILPEAWAEGDGWGVRVSPLSQFQDVRNSVKPATPDDWADLLMSAGWYWNAHGGYWCHPQSTSHRTARLTELNNLYVYGATSAPFEPNQSYSIWMAWELLRPGVPNPWSRKDASTGESPTLPSVNGVAPGVDSGREAAVTPAPFISSAAMKATPAAQWLVPQYLPEGAFAQLTGASGVGKSFVALDWAARLSQSGKRVLYAIGEGNARFPSRVAAWEERHGEMSVAFTDAPLNLFDAREIERVRHYGPWDLIIIDTLARHLFGRDEDGRGMMAFVEAAQRLQHAAGGTVLVVHHFGWTQAGQAGRQRGHSSLYGASDAVLYVVEYGNGLRVQVEKMKDGEENLSADYMLEAVGESCVLTPMGEVKPQVVAIEGVTYLRDPLTKGLRVYTES